MTSYVVGGAQAFGGLQVPMVSNATVSAQILSIGQPMTSVAALGQPRTLMAALGHPMTSVAQPGVMTSYSPGVASSYGAADFSTARIIQAPQATSFIQSPQVVAVGIAQQPVAAQYEVRDLPEDRIVRVQAVYKGDSLLSPSALAPAAVYEAAPVAFYETQPAQEKAAPGVLYETAPFAFYEEAPTAVNEMAPAEVYDQVQAEALEDDGGLMEALYQTLGSLPRVCILGGTTFEDEYSEDLVNSLAAAFSEWLADRVVVVTGGMPGVQETFAMGCAQGPAVVNMLPTGETSNSGVGVDFAFFQDLDERIAVFGQIGDIYISIEGGPGVSEEANAAFNRGAIVLPMMSTGGASGGAFDFPAGALEVSPYASPEQWELLATKGQPEDTARAVCEMILGMLPQEEQALVEQ